MTRATLYGTISTDEYGCDCRIEADNDQLYRWAAHRPGAHWPCSYLARFARIIVELADNGDLVDLAAYLPGERYAESEPDITAEELSAWIDDALTADPGALHALVCPSCNEAIWDGPQGSKLAKCWNTEGHDDGRTLAFDTMGDES